jgi:FMN-dependent NADH-azoreductase
MEAIMNKLLHIIATPRGSDSRTLKVSRVFIEEIKKKYDLSESDEEKLKESVLA